VRYTGRVAGSALVGAALLFSVSGGAASAATLPQLPISSLTQVIADSVHNELFLGTNASVVVTDLTGNLITTWGAAPKPGGMVTDGSSVYAVNGAVVDAFSAVAPVPTASAVYHLPAGDTPSSVAFQFGRIWVSYSSATETGAIGYWTAGQPAAINFHADALSAAGTWANPPRLAADPNPATEGTLVALDNAGGMIATYNVSGNAFQTTPKAESDVFAACTGLKDLAVSAGGGDFTLACSGGTGTLTYTNALVPVASPAITAGQGSVPSPDAVTYAPDNTGLAVGSNNGVNPSLSVFKLTGTPMTKDALAAANEIVAPGGLSWASDAVKLYAVLKDTNTGNYLLDTVVYAQYLTSNLDLMNTGTGNWVAGSKLTLKGSLSYENATGTGTTIPPVGTTVRLLRRLTTSNVSTTLLVKTVAGGGFTVIDTPPAGNYFYVAYYPGTGTDSPAWHTVRDNVTIGHTTLKVTTSASSVKAGTTITVTAHLGKWQKNKTVTIYGRVGNGGWTTIKRALVSPTGILTASVKVSKTMQFKAYFAGDGWYAALSSAIVTVSAH
jgi:hypothetical protein